MGVNSSICLSLNRCHMLSGTISCLLGRETIVHVVIKHRQLMQLHVFSKFPIPCWS